MLSPGMQVSWFPINMENSDLGDESGTVFGGLLQFAALPDALRKPVVSHHTQKTVLVRGATTHENSATMSLHGYGLA
jgi:hypothetical protein